MKKVNMLLVVGICLLFASRALAVVATETDETDDLTGVVATDETDDLLVLLNEAIRTEYLEANRTDRVVEQPRFFVIRNNLTDEERREYQRQIEIRRDSATTGSWLRWLNPLGEFDLPALQLFYRLMKEFVLEEIFVLPWANEPWMIAFREWHAGLREKRSLRIIENTLGVALFSVFAYQAWVYAYARGEAGPGAVSALATNYLITWFNAVKPYLNGTLLTRHFNGTIG